MLDTRLGASSPRVHSLGGRFHLSCHRDSYAEMAEAEDQADAGKLYAGMLSSPPQPEAQPLEAEGPGERDALFKVVRVHRAGFGGLTRVTLACVYESRARWCSSRVSGACSSGSTSGGPLACVMMVVLFMVAVCNGLR
jgi:hypothetical protein